MIEIIFASLGIVSLLIAGELLNVSSKIELDLCEKVEVLDLSNAPNITWQRPGEKT